MSTPTRTLRLDTAEPGTGLGLNADDTARYLDLAGKGLIVAKDCNGPAVQDDRALDPSTTVSLGSTIS